MPNEAPVLLKHIKIPKSRIKKLKKKARPGGFSEKYSKEEYEKFSEKLLAGLNTVVDFDVAYKESPISEHIFKITTKNEINQTSLKKTLENIGLKWLNPLSQYEVVVAIPNKKTEQLLSKISKYGSSGDLHSYFDRLSEIKPLSPANNISKNVENLGESESANLEIDFYSGLSLEDYENSIGFIKKIIGEKNLKYVKKDPEMPFVRVTSTKNEIKKVASSLPTIRKIERVPQISVLAGESKKTEEVEFEPAAEDLKTIMIIDCGVTHEHPGIKNVLIFRRNYIAPTINDTSDSNPDPLVVGHGTGVAGLAAYGMITDKLKHLTPTSKIAVAKILDKKEDDIPIQDYLESIVNDGVSRGIRIYSLTVMLRMEAKEISKLAFVIDKISKDKDVLFVISTGNLSIEKLEEFYRIGQVYPKYLSNNAESRIYEGAEACCAITVGGIAQLGGKRAIAQRFEASPFTRAGPTPDDRLKPDLVYFAGNLEQDFSSSEDLGLLSLNYKPSLGIYSTKNIGTSFSTPMVANLASQILRNYPDASANLIRALLIHSAETRDEFNNVSEPRFIYGFGFPNQVYMINSTKYAPTMIVESEIEADEVAEIRIPVPEEIRTSKGSKFMKITLAYDPKVSYADAKLNYSLINLSFGILRKTKKGYTKISGTSEGWQLNSYRRIPNNTVKKDRYQWERKHAGEDWIIRVESSLKTNKKDLPKQRFALVVTIEDARKETDLYSPIQQIFESEQIALTVANTQLIRPSSARNK